MSLTGQPLCYLVVALALAAVALTLWAWNAVPGHRVTRVMARLALIALCQVTALAVVGWWVNYQYGLYSSWSDLLGMPDTAAMDSGPAPDPATVAFTDAGGGILAADFHGPESHLRGQVLVWTPPEYHRADHRGYRFPVVLLLHGVPGSPQAWIRGGHATTALAAMMRTGTLAPAILVMPRIDPGINTDCTDLPRGPHTATWLAHDVYRLITTHFDVETQPGAWAVAGESTGGYCAAKLPLQYPQRFGTGLALSPDAFAGDPAVVAGKAVRRANDPVVLAAQGASVSLLVATSRYDPFSTAANALALTRAAVAPTHVEQPIVVGSGGHNWPTWIALYPKVFGWVNAHLAPPEPPGNILAAATPDCGPAPCHRRP